MNVKHVSMALLAFVTVGFVIGLIGRPLFGDEWDRLRPVVRVLLGAVVFVGVFVVAYRALVKPKLKGR